MQGSTSLADTATFELDYILCPVVALFQAVSAIETIAYVLTYRPTLLWRRSAIDVPMYGHHRREAAQRQGTLEARLPSGDTKEGAHRCSYAGLSSHLM